MGFYPVPVADRLLALIRVLAAPLTWAARHGA